MRAMILAAGRGERMRPLTDTTPKPLLRVDEHCLIEHQIKRLVAQGFNEIIINHAYLGHQIEQTLGNGEAYGAEIRYSPEKEQVLGTGGGIIHALPFLGSQPFLVVNSDIWCNYPLAHLRNALKGLAHLVLIDNPPHHPQGDFALTGGQINIQEQPRLTFSGIGVYHPDLFKDYPVKPISLVPLLISAMQREQVSGTYYQGQWFDIGTPERLYHLRQIIAHEKTHTFA